MPHRVEIMDRVMEQMQPNQVGGGVDAASGEEVRRRLNASRRELLDLSGRNRLLNTPRRRSRSRSIEILDEFAEQVYRRLVVDGAAMTFDPRPEADTAAETGASAAQERPTASADLEALETPTNSAPGESSAAPQPDPQRADDRLQTDLSSQDLQNRLLRIYYDARTYQEEHGINTLYLALGFLKWIEPPAGNAERHAPLLLVPVELQRASARSRFRLRWSGEDITTNLSLQTKLKVEFGIELPDVGEDEDFEPADYFEKVRSATQQAPKWEVLPNDIVLGFFSFAKLLMYLDLDSENWPGDRRLDRHHLISALLGAQAVDGAATMERIDSADAANAFDSHASNEAPLHILDADSSQTAVIDEVRRGCNLVIQGPPGTGKSQTIANVIGAAVRDGKRVLFVAEKLAALSVVKARLDRIGLGDMCLELHSNKVQKSAVLNDLRRALALERPRTGEFDDTIRRLDHTARALDGHVAMLHGRLEPYGLSPYEIVGELVRLRDRGVAPADFKLEAALSWTPSQRERRIGLANDLARAVAEIGRPDRHPWRGSQLDAALPADLHRLINQTSGALAAVTELRGWRDELGAQLGLPAKSADTGETFGEAQQVAAMGSHLAAAPPLDFAALASAAWRDDRARIKQLVDALLVLHKARTTLADVVIDVAWTADVQAARRDLAAYGRSWLRWLRPDYREAKRTLRGILKAAPPRSLDERLAILDSIIAAQHAQKTVHALEGLGQEAFGSRWTGDNADSPALAAIDAWDEQGMAISERWADVRHAAAARADDRNLAADSQQLRAQLDRCLDMLANLFAAVKLDVAEAFDLREPQSTRDSLNELSVTLAHERLAAWRDEPEELSKWIRFRELALIARDEGLGDIVDRLYDGRVSPEQAVDRLGVAIFEQLMHDAARRHPSLAAFEGKAHERLREQFRQLDLRFIALSRQEVAAAHYQSIPRGSAQIGELGIIQHELSKRRRHLPIRQLLQRAGNAVAAIKPVFMMSPLSVAKYLEPGAFQFDILMIDEASQVMPVDAFGAIARARQIVVVGDDKQLPPTRFFTKLLEEAEFDDIDPQEIYAGDVESILGLCASRGIEQRMLRWHYRSKHHSLIAVSNREFYDNRLLVIPSPRQRDRELGLQYRRIEGSEFDRGGSATNRVEALAVAQAVMDHMREVPHLTLGVGAFSIQQRDAIIDELERLRRDDPDLEPLFAAGVSEPFFVKNLENIQGDERDVIFISVGYGPDKDGRISMNFGPLSAQGGERRLNVLITRAKNRCVVFTALQAADIDLSRATGRGPQAFKAFLAYAERGELAPPGGGEDTTGGGTAPGSAHVIVETSGIEQSIADAARGGGAEVDSAIGVAGFFVDLAVRDARHDGRYTLGIECDGASYAGAGSTRDRERSRGDVLRSRGWNLQRIWSLDWFLRPREQHALLMRAIEKPNAADTPNVSTPPTASTSSTSEPFQGIIRGEVSADDREAGAATPYVEARFKPPARKEPHEISSIAMAEVVAAIVAVEGPVHVDEIAARVRTIWRLSRLTPRTIESVQRGVREAQRMGRIHCEGDFCLITRQAPVTVRDRSNVISSGLRSVEMLPPMEVQQCIKALVADHLGATRDEAIVSAARQLGFRSTSAPLRQFIDQQINMLLAQGDLRDTGDRLEVLET